MLTTTTTTTPAVTRRFALSPLSLTGSDGQPMPLPFTARIAEVGRFEGAGRWVRLTQAGIGPVDVRFGGAACDALLSVLEALYLAHGTLARHVRVQIEAEGNGWARLTGEEVERV